MPLPKRLARFNLAVTNRVLGPFARWLPGFAVVEHVGRRSGTVRRSPVNLFRRRDRYVIALTYGKDSQWVRNVQAAGEFAVTTRGRRLTLTAPELVHDERRTLVPAPVRAILGLVDVTDFLVSRAGPTGGAPAPPPSPRESAPPRSGPPARP
jgi:deazaflavin-dependent oxidoreductase (nitroreductase family)